MIATIALMAGLPQAQADELADLRANELLLQQKIDQLAQAAHAPGAPGVAAGSFPRSILIPGTNTSLSVGGYVELDTSFWVDGGPPNGNVQTPVIGENGQALFSPLLLHGQVVPGVPASVTATPFFNGRKRGQDIFQMTARESRLRVETRTPTPYGPAGTVFEFDWLGCNNLSCNALDHVSNNLLPRLRLGFGTLGPWLAGQAFGTTVDLAASPETLDFGGPVGEWGVVRLAQLRYTAKLPFGSTLALALEQPETDVATPAGGVYSDTSAIPAVDGIGIPTSLAVDPAVAQAPNFASYFQITRPWGHLRFQGVLRDLALNDGARINKSWLGWGTGFTGNVKPWLVFPKDNLVWQAGVGQGIGQYMNSASSFGLQTNYGGTGLYGSAGGPTSAAAAALIHAKPIWAWFGMVGYQHWWRFAPGVRSTVAFGIQHQDISPGLVGPIQAAVGYNKQVYTTHVNLIWSPVSFVDVGLEYMHAQRKTVANIPGTEDEIQGMFRVKF